MDLNCHVIVTLRSKTEYVQEKDEKTGKTRVKKLGLAPVQRDDFEYEFMLVMDCDKDTHNATIIKDNNQITLKGGFSFNLTDFSLEPPVMMFLKVRNQIDISYNISLSETK